MAHSFFIGIGGTGAKCAEALIHLCAAGLGPDRCSVMLVDQDEPNGNGVRCHEILRAYIDLRSRLATAGERTENAGPALFRTEISIPGGTPLWCPTNEHGDTLGKIAGYDVLKEQQALTDCLFLPEERNQRLGEGFRAHPSVGAAVLLAKSETETAEAFWKNVFASIDEARSGQEVRIFLLGSIFGGTGAAGFPTIARLIHRQVKEQAGTAVKIGGALMLPYFRFPPPQRENSGELLPNSSIFLEQTQGALRYYHRLLIEGKLFENVYLIGWDPLLRINAYSKGGAEQRNPALVPELWAGLAALRFFAGADTAPVVDFERSDSGQVNWRDLPRIHAADEDEVRENFGALIRFAHAFHGVYRPALGRERWRSARHEAWFRRLLDRDGALLTQSASQALLDDLDLYCQGLLLWAASIAFGDTDDKTDVRLYDASQFARPVSEGGFDRAALSEQIDLRSFGYLIPGEEGPDLPLVFERLTYDRFGSRQAGVAPFVRALHQACCN